MTGGQRPDAPSAHSGADPGPADLGAITGCDALLDLVAGRRLDTPLVRRDPALAVLSLLAADVDGAATDGTAPGRTAPDGHRATACRLPARRPLAHRAPTRRAPAHRAARRAPACRPRQGAVAAVVASALAALIVAVVVAGTTSLLAASTLARLTRPGRGPARSPGR